LRCYAHVGDVSAVRVLSEAGVEELRADPERGAEWFAAALELLGESDENIGQRAQLTRLRAQALVSAAHLEEAHPVAQAALDLQSDEPSAERTRSIALAALIDYLRGKRIGSRASLERELSKHAGADLAETAELLSVMCVGSLLDSDHASLGRLAEQGLSLSSTAPADRAQLMGALAASSSGLGATADARRQIDDAADLLDTLREPELAGRPGALIWLGLAELCVDRPAEALGHLDAGANTLQRFDRYAAPAADLVRAGALTIQGRLDSAEGAIDRAVALATSSHAHVFMPIASCARAYLALERGDLAAVVAHVGTLGRPPESAPRTGVERFARSLLAETWLCSGESQRCLELLLDKNEQLWVGSPPFGELRFQELATRASLASDDVTAARRWAGRALSRAEELGLPLSLALAKRANAAVLLHSGKPAEAATVAFEAVEHAEIAPIEAARARTLAGSALVETRRKKDAVAVLRKAYVELASRGAARYVDEVTSELRRLGQRVPRDAANNITGTGLDALTPRQRQVAELVAQGKKNREIAAALYLSKTTVERHLASIFRRLGVSSRIALATLVEQSRHERRS
jgi:DNA-binding CsgD family transcriptional regulator